LFEVSHVSTLLDQSESATWVTWPPWPITFDVNSHMTRLMTFIGMETNAPWT
jgi:hypothetical protein